MIKLTKETVVVGWSLMGGNYVSSRTLLQYGQFIWNGRFSEFDYMKPEINYQYYGQPNAPDYPLAKITSRNLVLFRGANDVFYTKFDHDHLVNSLSVRPLDVYVIPNPMYNHADFVFAKENNRFINWRILGHLNNYHFKVDDKYDQDDSSE